MIKAGVIGWPVDHSLSPRLHGWWLQRYGIAGSYEKYPVSANALGSFIQNLHRDGFKGVNVTIPYKEDVIAFMHELTPAAQRIGAVNTILVMEDGRLQGDNTDCTGFMAPLQALGQRWRRDRAVVVFGAGGAARAVVDALRQADVPEIRIINRDQAKARLLGDDLLLYRWRELDEALQGAGLLVNTTPLGMHATPMVDVNIEPLPDDAVVYDLIYNPWQTKLLKMAAPRLCLNGMEMLIQQAAPGFARWFGVTPEVTDELRAYMREALP